LRDVRNSPVTRSWLLITLHISGSPDRLYTSNTKGQLLCLLGKKEKSFQKVESFVLSIRNQAVLTAGLSDCCLCQARETHEISQSESIRYTRCCSLWKRNKVCCLRIIAPGRKARSAILIYKGSNRMPARNKNTTAKFLAENSRASARRSRTAVEYC